VTRVSIREIAAGGDGVGRLDDGRVVFVPRTAPDEVVEIEVTSQKGRFARGRVAQVVTPGPDRVDPRCPHYQRDACGGCQIQHLTQEAQLTAKRNIVRQALTRIGRRSVPEVEITPPEAPWRYRTTLTLAVDDAGRAGLHPWDEPDAVFPLVDCLITAAPLMDLWRELRTRLDLVPGETTRVVLRLDRDGGKHLIVKGGSPPWDWSGLEAALPDVALWWQPKGGAARLVAGEKTGFPATAFAQNQPALADRIRAVAVEELADVAGLPVWDLYGGTGDGARLLAAKGARVTSVDADRSAVEWASGRPRPEGSLAGSPAYVAGLVEEVLHRLPEPAAVLLNPPRTGLHARVASALERLAGAGLRRMAYVSCDPATLARDLSRMPSFRLTGVRAFDLFPQTSHVETVAALEAA
jgi:23S rRNA (uracil1939-C5)-methyltransferase